MNTVPYFDSAEEWVNSLPYDRPVTFRNGNTYTYTNPFNSIYGQDPKTVYNNLFKEDHYYVTSDKELTELRTTIQYVAVHLDDTFDRVSQFLKDRGFVNYKNENDPSTGLRGAYFKRGTASIFIGNVECPQSYVPNKIDMEICELVKSPKTGKTRRVQKAHGYIIPLLDDLGEKTAEVFEKTIDMLIVNKEEKDMANRYKFHIVKDPVGGKLIMKHIHAYKEEEKYLTNDELKQLYEELKQYYE